MRVIDQHHAVGLQQRQLRIIRREEVHSAPSDQGQPVALELLGYQHLVQRRQEEAPCNAHIVLGGYDDRDQKGSTGHTKVGGNRQLPQQHRLSGLHPTSHDIEPRSTSDNRSLHIEQLR